jgi:hypothetical protein
MLNLGHWAAAYRDGDNLDVRIRPVPVHYWIFYALGSHQARFRLGLYRLYWASTEKWGIRINEGIERKQR